jgi:hypothetical protein
LLQLLLFTQILLRNALAQQAPAWRILFLQAGACKAIALPSWSLVTRGKFCASSQKGQHEILQARHHPGFLKIDMSRFVPQRDILGSKDKT